MTVARSIKAQLDEAEHVIRAQMDRIAELTAEVERLKAGLSAHEVLQSIYRNSAAPEGHRIKAATAALPHETPKLTSVPPPLDLTAEPVIPLADLVTARRARQNELEVSSIEVTDSDVRVQPKPGSNGNGGDRDGE